MSSFIDFSSAEWNPLVRGSYGTVDADDLVELVGHRLVHAGHAHTERVGENEVVEILLDGGRGRVDDAPATLLHVRHFW